MGIVCKVVLPFPSDFPPCLFSRNGTRGLKHASQTLARKLPLHSSHDHRGLFLNCILSEPGENTKEVLDPLVRWTGKSFGNHYRVVLPVGEPSLWKPVGDAEHRQIASMWTGRAQNGSPHAWLGCPHPCCLQGSLQIVFLCFLHNSPQSLTSQPLVPLQPLYLSCATLSFVACHAILTSSLQWRSLCCLAHRKCVVNSVLHAQDFFQWQGWVSERLEWW